MNRMVFCNLIEKNGSELLYSIGGRPDDLTGRLSVNTEDGSFEIQAEPENSKVYTRHVSAMLRKAQSDYSAGNFKERLSYEI